MRIRTAGILIAGGLLLLACPALGDDVSVKTVSWPYQSGFGGEFRAELVNGDLHDDFGMRLGHTWSTFCVEYDEIIGIRDRTYDYIVNTKAVHGGEGPEGDPLDYKTAYLFDGFIRGTLTTTYRYDGTLTERKADAEALQQAIWLIEEEIAGPLSGKALLFYQEAVTAGWTDIGNVRVLNLYDSGHSGDESHRIQDILVLVPLPPAAALGLFLLAGLGLARTLRRRT